VWYSLGDDARQNFRNSSVEDAMNATTVQLRRKGVLTLPASLRRKYGFQENDVFTLQDLGDGSMLLVPQLSQVARQGDRVAELMEEQDVSVEEMLQTLEEERETYYKEHYEES
jgi:bifunctional DNA-binding transcriptional regulator/antitoxin component of YhaV-PrlF toxin-antitoxin module